MGTHTPNTDTPTNPLQTENPAVVAILTDPTDYAAMRPHTAFPFRDHGAYLRHVEDLLRTHAASGQHTIAVLFDPDAYASFCTDLALDPTSAASRARYVVEDALLGAHVIYEGQNLTELISDLLDRAVQHATWEYGSQLLASLGPCAVCGQDIGQTAFQQATRLVAAFRDHAEGAGSQLACSLSVEGETLTAVLRTGRGTDRTAGDDGSGTLRFATLLAVGLATDASGGIVMRTFPTGTTSAGRVYGWRLRRGILEPLTAAEVFDTYATSHTPGELVAPPSDTEYCAGFDLPNDPGHGHGY